MCSNSHILISLSEGDINGGTCHGDMMEQPCLEQV